MSWTFEATERGYANLWKSATLKGGADAANADTFSDKIIAAEQRYRSVQASTSVPWYFIGALHMRESSCNFAGVLHNGQHIIGTGGLTTIEPIGRGPFSSWEEAAIDALKLKSMQRVQSWSVARMLYQAEVFNGLGYVGHGTNSPYVWAGTNHEQPGKYIRDHVWDGTFDDPQIGVAAVLIRLAEKRPDIHADLYPATSVEKPPVSDDPSDVIKEIQNLRSDITQLISSVGTLVNAIKGVAPSPAPIVEPKPEPTPTPAPAPVPAPAPSSNPLQQPGVGLGALGLVITGLLQAFGIMGPTTGETATTAGQVLPILSAGSMALGATGTFGTILNAIGTVASLFAKSQPK